MLARLRTSAEDKDQGFTLIELLVVIIIIGILAAIAIPVFLNQRKKGWDAAVKSDLRNAATSQETFLTDRGTYTKVVATATVATPVASLTDVGFKYSSGSNYSTGTASITSLINAGQAYCLSAISASGNTFYYDNSLGGFTAACSTGVA